MDYHYFEKNLICKDYLKFYGLDKADKVDWSKLKKNMNGRIDCLVCKMSLASYCNAKQHFKEQHMIYEKPKCKKCNKTFTRQRSKDDHVLKLHGFRGFHKSRGFRGFRVFHGFPGVLKWIVKDIGPNKKLFKKSLIESKEESPSEDEYEQNKEMTETKENVTEKSGWPKFRGFPRFPGLVNWMVMDIGPNKKLFKKTFFSSMDI